MLEKFEKILYNENNKAIKVFCDNYSNTFMYQCHKNPQSTNNISLVMQEGPGLILTR